MLGATKDHQRYQLQIIYMRAISIRLHQPSDRKRGELHRESSEVWYSSNRIVVVTCRPYSISGNPSYASEQAHTLRLSFNNAFSFCSMILTTSFARCPFNRRASSNNKTHPKQATQTRFQSVGVKDSCGRLREPSGWLVGWTIFCAYLRLTNPSI